MKPYLYLNCVAVVAGVASATVACHTEAPEATASDQLAASTGAALEGARVEYDETNDQVVVRFDRALREDERAFIGVRRGLVGNLDCARDSDSLSPIEADGAVVRGPSAPAELFESFYSPEWFQGELTATMLAEASIGTDPLIDVCVLRDGAVVFQRETSLPFAIDEARQADARARWSYGLRNPTGQAIQSGQKYAERCVEEMGDIPFFPKNGPGDYGTYDCRDGVEIPVTVTDASGNTTRATSTPSKCDKPQHLGYGCEVGARVSNVTNSRGTEWVLLCRKVIDKVQGKYSDIAMIGHNPTSGKTCFIQNSLGAKVDGANVRHPADTNDAIKSWRPYVSGGSCVGCHDTDPFIHTPWIDGAKTAAGATVVPKVAYPESPYTIVDQLDQGFSVKKQLVSAGADACRQCHRVGEWQSRRWPDYLNQTDTNVTVDKTDFYRRPEQQYWMPGYKKFKTKADWDSSSEGKAASFIAGCINNPSQCRYEPIPAGLVTVRREGSAGLCGLSVVEPPVSLQPTVVVTLSVAPLEASFDCNSRGNDIEIVPSGNGKAVYVRTKRHGNYCYLAADYELPSFTPILFATTSELGWDCSFGIKSEFEVTYANGDQARLTKRIGNATCGVRASNTLVGTTAPGVIADCNHAGDLLYIAEDVHEGWSDGRAAASVETHYGPFDVLDGTRFSAVMAPRNNSGGDADLYVRFGAAPTTVNFDCRPYTSTSAERCEPNAPSGGAKAYVMVRGYSGTTDYELTVDYTTD